MQNDSVKGFALLITLLFLLLLTLYGFSLLLMATSYYSSSHNLFEKENARIMCESAGRYIIDLHNHENGQERFFFNPARWTASSMKSFQWNGYFISGDLENAWNQTAINRLSLYARKGSFVAKQELYLRQRRLEDFAFFSDGSQILPTASLFAGSVFVRGAMELQQPGVRFLQVTHGKIFPESFATYRKRSLQVMEYPQLDRLSIPYRVFLESGENGLVVSGQNELFWNKDHYELNLDELHVEAVKAKWNLYYKGKDLGRVSLLSFWFDDELQIKQTNVPLPFLPSNKQKAPLYLSSAGDIVVHSSLSPMESRSANHPLCLVSLGTIRVSPLVPRASRFAACLIALGDDLVIENGGVNQEPSEQAAFLKEVNTSELLLEEEKKNDLANALAAGEKVVWFRGSVIVNGSLRFSSEETQVHFQSSGDTYPVLPSFPFVYVVEGGRRWR